MHDRGPYVPLPNRDLRRWSGWVAHASYRRRQPDRMDRTEFGRLDAAAQLNWNVERADWHANLPFVETAQSESAIERLAALLASSRQATDEVKQGLLLDGLAGMGKTAIMRSWLYETHRTLMEKGDVTETGHRRMPIVHVSMRDASSKLALAQRLLFFQERPGVSGGERNVTSRVIDTLFSCETEIIFIDELHFFGLTEAIGRHMSNYIKTLMNDTPCTFVFAGNEVFENDFFRTKSRVDVAADQFRSLVETRKVHPFSIRAEGVDQWYLTLKTLESNLRLLDQQPGDICWRCADTLWALTGGRWRSLRFLLLEATGLAMKSGEERITPQLLMKCGVSDLAQEHANRTLPTLGSGLWSARPARPF